MGDTDAAGAFITRRRRATFAAGIGLQPMNERSAAVFQSPGIGDFSTDSGPKKNRDRFLETVQSKSKSEKKKRRNDMTYDTLR